MLLTVSFVYSGVPREIFKYWHPILPSKCGCFHSPGSISIGNPYRSERALF